MSHCDRRSVAVFPLYQMIGWNGPERSRACQQARRERTLDGEDRSVELNGRERPRELLGLYPALSGGKIAVRYKMQRDLAWEPGVNRAQKLEEFLMPMPLIALANHLPLQYLQSGE